MRCRRVSRTSSLRMSCGKLNETTVNVALNSWVGFKLSFETRDVFAWKLVEFWTMTPTLTFFLVKELKGVIAGEICGVVCRLTDPVSRKSHYSSWFLYKRALILSSSRLSKRLNRSTMRIVEFSAAVFRIFGRRDFL